MKIKIGLVDNHQLFLKSLALMLEALNDFEVVVEAINGQDLQQKIQAKKVIPDIMLIDVNMPIMNGIETTIWLQQHFPSVKLVALSVDDNDNAIIKMFKAGCCAYLLKDIHPVYLEKALHEVNEKGYYNGDTALFSPKRLLQSAESRIVLTTKEEQFLKHACSELTYKQIAGVMNLSERTIDGYREALFRKLEVQSRVGMCLEALRREIVKL